MKLTDRQREVLWSAVREMQAHKRGESEGLNCRRAALRVANRLEDLGLVMVYPDQNFRGGWVFVGDDIIDKVLEGVFGPEPQAC